MRPVEFHLDAEAELDEAFEYLEQQRAGVGEEFYWTVETVLARIRQYPLAAALINPDVRRVRVGIFPYSIVYRFREDRIRVIAVMHIRREPGYWSHRH